MGGAAVAVSARLCCRMYVAGLVEVTEAAGVTVDAVVVATLIIRRVREDAAKDSVRRGMVVG